MTVAREINRKSPLAIAGTKEMLNYARDHSVADSLNHNATWQAGMFYSQDTKEAMAARTEKREPKFQDILPIKGSMVNQQAAEKLFVMSFCGNETAAESQPYDVILSEAKDLPRGNSADGDSSLRSE